MNSKGFTLIELMVTVAIIGIIAAIAYPSYVEQVRKTRRVDAQADLVELTSYMERYYTENFSYQNASGAAPSLPFTESPLDGGIKYYDLSVSAASSSVFVLTADPKNGQGADTCGTMTVNQAGEKTPTTSGCWQ